MTRRDRFTFTGSTGHELDARLDLPEDDPVAFALFAHCFTCSKDLAAAAAISEGLVQQGVGVLRFDFTGLGSSEGEFANTDFSSNVEDLVLAADAVRVRHGAPSLLIGHSLGGAAMLVAADQIPDAAAVVTIGAPFDPAHVTELFSESVDQILSEGEARVSLAGRPFTITRQLLDDLGSQAMDSAIATLDVPLLVMHSPVDEQVGIDNARRIYDSAKHPKSFLSLDGADHLLTDRFDGRYAAGVLAAWATRYLPGAELDQVAPPPVERADGGGQPLEGTVVVTEADGGEYRQLVRARSHRIAADEPLGTGDDTGPTPYELLLAALGTCTSMTVRMYATRKNLPLDSVSVELEHGREHATDCADGSDSCRIERIVRVITLDGPDLTDEQRSRLLEIAGRCPVHRTLLGDLRIDTFDART